MRAYLTSPAPLTGKEIALIFILIIGALIMKHIFQKQFPNVSGLKATVITAAILLAVTVIYLILVPS